MMEMLLHIVGGMTSLLIGLYILYKFYIQKTNPYLVSEADRALNHNFKKTDNWTSQGRVYIQGMSLTKNKNGELKLTRQSKLADSGLLYD